VRRLRNPEKPINQIEAAMLKSLLYVSRSRLSPAESAAQVEGVVRLARSRNEGLGITGALMFTEASFAQVIEGSAAALEELMASINADPRHSDIRIIRASCIDERRFGGWSMAYAGPSFYVNRHIKPLLADEVNERERATHTDRLVGLMHEFMQGQSKPG
jgi:hypothetical protein